MSEVKCMECVHRARAGSNTVHSRCNHPTVDNIMSDHDVLILVMDGLVNKHKVPGPLWDLKVDVEPSAIANGWGLWPFNFDPRWVNSCSGFSRRE